MESLSHSETRRVANRHPEPAIRELAQKMLDTWEQRAREKKNEDQRIRTALKRLQNRDAETVETLRLILEDMRPQLQEMRGEMERLGRLRKDVANKLAYVRRRNKELELSYMTVLRRFKVVERRVRDIGEGIGDAESK
jgi:hypothetical protein